MYTSVKFKTLKDVGMGVPKNVETRMHPCSKTGDHDIQQ